MGAVAHVELRFLDRRMALEVGADELAVPGPVVLRVRGRVHAHVAVAGADVALEGRLLRAVQHVTRGGHEHHGGEPAQRLVGESRSILGRLDGEAVRRAECLTAAMPSGIDAWRKPLVREKTSTRLPAGARADTAAHRAAARPAAADAAGTTVSGLREEPVEQAAGRSEDDAGGERAGRRVEDEESRMGRRGLTMDERRDRARARRRKMSGRSALSQCERAGTTFSILTVERGRLLLSAHVF